MKSVKYQEVQRFREISMYLFIGILLSGLLLKAVQLYTISEASNQFSDIVLAMFLLGSVLVYFLTIRMETTINKKGISYQYFPIHYKKQRISWDEIERVQLTEIPLSSQLSGWNVQFFRTKSICVGAADKGLTLDLKNGKQLFIGLNNLEKAEAILNRLGKISE